MAKASVAPSDMANMVDVQQYANPANKTAPSSMMEDPLTDYKFNNGEFSNFGSTQGGTAGMGAGSAGGGAAAAANGGGFIGFLAGMSGKMIVIAVFGIGAAVGGIGAIVAYVVATGAADNSGANSFPAGEGVALHTGITMDQVAGHNFKSSCWIAVHGKVLDVTEWRKEHPGGKDAFTCGEDNTQKFQNQHGGVESLERRIAQQSQYVKDLGKVATLKTGSGSTSSSTSSSSSSGSKKIEFDFSNVQKQPHPGSGAEWKTMVYIELKGGVDGAAMFVNVNNPEEVNLWCGKRPTLSGENYCTCLAPSSTAAAQDCTSWQLRRGPTGNADDRYVSDMAGTAGQLAMTDVLGGGSKGWMQLWNENKMSIVAGVGRYDHGRSHFEVKDAAAKGVSVAKEAETTHGWLAKSIFAYNNLYTHPPDSAKAKDPALPDGISLANAAAGPNALEVSDDSISHTTFQHISGVKSVDGVVASSKFDFVNPFTAAKMMAGSGSSLRKRTLEGAAEQVAKNSLVVPEEDSALLSSTSEDIIIPPGGNNYVDHAEQPQCGARYEHAIGGGSWGVKNSNIGDHYNDLLATEHANTVQCIELRQMTDEEEWSTTKSNLGLEELLAKEASIFQGVGVMQEKLAQYRDNLSTLCPNFPATAEWADSSSDAQIGMQLRAVAILLVNGVRPKVFQLQQTKYDTHSNQGARLQTLLSDLKTGVYTFVRAAEACGFANDVLVTTFSEFGRRLEENSRKGTDHGWSSYFAVFGTGLQRKVFGYDPVKQSAELGSIIPRHSDAYVESKGTKGDLPLITSVQTWNACLLNALALPALPRLGRCPLRLRNGLAQIPYYEEQQYYKQSSASSATTASSSTAQTTTTASSATSTTGSTAHLTQALTTTELLHFSRRIGFAPQALNFHTDIATARTNAVQQPTARNPDGSANTTVTLQQAISRVLAPANTATPAADTQLFLKWKIRKFNALALWSKERQMRRNNWEEILQLPYPAQDSFHNRVQRWDLAQFFDMSSLYINPNNPHDGRVDLHANYVGKGHLLLQHLQTKATIFYMALPVSKATGKAKDNWLDDDGKVKDETKVAWYQTVMQVPDVKEITALTVQKVIDDRKCSTGGTATDPCDPECDLTKFLDIYHNNSTAMFKPEHYQIWKGPDGTKQTAPWFKLKTCAKPDNDRKTFEHERANQLKLKIAQYLQDRYFADFTSTSLGQIRARMTWFFLNFYATPKTAVNDDLLMYKQYETLWRGSLGNYRTLALQMFNDKALRKSLDQLEEVECGTAPIENFAREWFERFTVGLRAHNEGDVKRLSKGLMNCKDDSETANLDLMQPGVIFSDPMEIPWTLTYAEQKALVDRILDKKIAANEPPAAAQFLCWKLYNEFGVLPSMDSMSGMSLSSIGMPPAVVSCATHFYDHNYDLTFALEYILQDQAHFRDTLGTKTRWPHAVIFGAWTEFQPDGMDRSHAVWRMTQVGMQPFEPQDVSGYDLHSVWTLDRISAAHKFLEQKVKPKLQQASEKWHFDNSTIFETTYADYALIPKSGSEQAMSGNSLYSYAVKLCSNEFVDVKGMEGKHIIQKEVLFDPSNTDYNSRNKRYQAWKAALEIAVSNVCQFVC
ncbi:unnamed protein product [Amoebophrya sp. A120]|nr:unnamed protein product [Amoebophrya sp. A120]|eukprot:GSA120T00001355001.1